MSERPECLRSSEIARTLPDVIRVPTTNSAEYVSSNFYLFFFTPTGIDTLPGRLARRTCSEYTFPAVPRFRVIVILATTFLHEFLICRRQNRRKRNSARPQRLPACVYVLRRKLSSKKRHRSRGCGLPPPFCSVPFDANLATLRPCAKGPAKCADVRKEPKKRVQYVPRRRHSGKKKKKRQVKMKNQL